MGDIVLENPLLLQGKYFVGLFNYLLLQSKGVERLPKTKTKLKPPETEVHFGWSWWSRTDSWVVWPFMKPTSFWFWAVCMFLTQSKKDQKKKTIFSWCKFNAFFPSHSYYSFWTKMPKPCRLLFLCIGVNAIWCLRKFHGLGWAEHDASSVLGGPNSLQTDDWVVWASNSRTIRIIHVTSNEFWS